VAHKNRRVCVANTIRHGQIPLWLAAHEAGHIIARIQLVPRGVSLGSTIRSVWNLSGSGSNAAARRGGFAGGGTQSRSHSGIMLLYPLPGLRRRLGFGMPSPTTA
jgi:hypothetical protein